MAGNEMSYEYTAADFSEASLFMKMIYENNINRKLGRTKAQIVKTEGDTVSFTDERGTDTYTRVRT